MPENQSDPIEQATELSSRLTEQLAPLPQRSMPGFLKYFPSVIQEFHSNGADFKLDGSTGDLVFEGFYKNNTVRLVEKNNQFVAVDKKGKEHLVRSWDDLCKLNYRFWVAANPISSTSKGIYTEPERPYLDYFIREKLVERVVMFIPRQEKNEE